MPGPAKSFLFILLLLPAAFCYSQNWQDNWQKADEIHKTDIKGAIDLYLKVETAILPDSAGTIAYGALCFALGQSYSRIDDYPKAYIYLVKAKAIIATRIGKETNEYASACNSLGLLSKRMKDYKQAESYYLEEKKILETISGTANPQYPATLNNLALLYDETNDKIKAEEFYIKAKDIREKNLAADADSAGYAVSCNSLGSFYCEVGRLPEGLSLLFKAKTIQESIIDEKSPDYCLTLNNIARAYESMEEFDKAEFYYLKTKGILETIIAANRPYNVATFLNNLAQFYKRMGRFEEAEAYCLEAKKILQNNIGEYNALGVNIHLNCARIYRDQVDVNLNPAFLDKSKIEFLEALKIQSTLATKDSTEFCEIYNGLGLLLQIMNENLYADSILRISKRISSKIKGYSDLYSDACNNLGLIYFSGGQYDKAIAEFHEVYQKDSSVAILSNLANVYYLTGNLIKADSFYRKAYSLIFNKINNVFLFASEKEKEKYLATVLRQMDYYFSFYYKTYAQTGTSQAYNIALQTKNLTLASTAALKKQVLNSKDGLQNNSFIKWNSINIQLAQLYSANDKQEFIKVLEDSANRLEKELLRLYPYAKKSISIKNIQSRLNATDAAIEFISFRYYNGKKWTDSTFYAAMVLKRNSKEPVFIPLFEEKDLLKIVPIGNAPGKYRGISVSNNLGVDSAVASLIWSPLEKELTGIKRVYISLSGLLHKIPFAELPVNKDSILLDKYELRYLMTTADISNEKNIALAKKDNIILFGGADYNNSDAGLKKDTLTPPSSPGNYFSTLQPKGTHLYEWPYLQGTQKETRNILQLVTKRGFYATLYSGTNATEEKFKMLNGKKSPALLHIATHGFFLNDTVVADMSENLKHSHSSLLRSGLLFSGANKAWMGNPVTGKEDGILTSYEISNIFLPTTKLAILSACETGLGDIQGSEGVYGLQRAFKIAGVEYLIMSLWQVPDEETAIFMEELYSNLLQNQPIEEAFQKTQKAIRKKFEKNPYGWAAWVLIR